MNSRQPGSSPDYLSFRRRSSSALPCAPSGTGSAAGIERLRAALELIRYASGYAIPDPAFKGWVIHSRQIWTPENVGFDPQALRCLHPYIDAARRYWKQQSSESSGTESESIMP